MTIHTRIGHPAKTTALSIASLACLGLSSCTHEAATGTGVSSGISPATQQFAEQHGFKPSDYFGAYGSNDRVTGDVNRRYYRSSPEERPSVSGPRNR